jgi:hypothetical protein
MLRGMINGDDYLGLTASTFVRGGSSMKRIARTVGDTLQKKSLSAWVGSAEGETKKLNELLRFMRDPFQTICEDGKSVKSLCSSLFNIASNFSILARAPGMEM